MSRKVETIQLFPSRYATATIKVAAASGTGRGGFHLSRNGCRKNGSGNSRGNLHGNQALLDPKLVIPRTYFTYITDLVSLIRRKNCLTKSCILKNLQRVLNPFVNVFDQFIETEITAKEMKLG